MHLSHEHFIIDAILKKTLNFDERKKITENLISDLLKTLKMIKLGKLEIYDATDDKFPGWSFIQPITTSHISGHYFEESDIPSHIHLDIYSCKSFDWKLVISILDQHLGLGAWSGNLIMRELQLDKRTTLLLKGLGNKVDMKESISITK
jgi:hypothetical protein